MKITKITNLYPKAIQVDMDNGEWAQIYEFGKTLYTTTSDRVKKSTLVELKKDILLVDWDATKLTQLYINE